MTEFGNPKKLKKKPEKERVWRGKVHCFSCQIPIEVKGSYYLVCDNCFSTISNIYQEPWRYCPDGGKDLSVVTQLGLEGKKTDSYTCKKHGVVRTIARH